MLEKYDNSDHLTVMMALIFMFKQGGVLFVKTILKKMFCLPTISQFHVLFQPELGAILKNLLL